MNKLLLALAVVLVIAGTASAQYIVPEVVTSYYPPVYAAPQVVTSYYQAPVPYTAPAPWRTRPTMRRWLSRVPAWRTCRWRRRSSRLRPSWFAPVVVRSKVYYPGHPIRNTVRYVVP